MRRFKFQKISRLIIALLIMIYPFISSSGNLSSVKAGVTDGEGGSGCVLTLAVDPEGSGTIQNASNNEVITGAHALGEGIYLKAVPEVGYEFDSWEAKNNQGENKDLTELPSYSINASGDILQFSMPDIPFIITANFKAVNNSLTLAVDPSGSGTISGYKNNNSSQTITSDEELAFHTPVHLTATPENGYSFDHWGFEPGGSDQNYAEVTDNELSLTMPDMPVTVTAHFVESPIVPAGYGLTLTIDPTEGGIIKDGDGNVVAAGSVNYESGSQMNFTAEPKSGYKFKEWTGDYISDTATENLEFTMPDHNVTLTAVFEKEAETETKAETKTETETAFLKTSDDFNMCPYVISLIASGALYFLLKISVKKVAKRYRA